MRGMEVAQVGLKRVQLFGTSQNWQKRRMQNDWVY